MLAAFSWPWERIFTEHPEALHMDAAELHRRFWPYNPYIVAVRRFQASILIGLKPLMRRLNGSKSL